MNDVKSQQYQLALGIIPENAPNYFEHVHCHLQLKTAYFFRLNFVK